MVIVEELEQSSTIKKLLLLLLKRRKRFRVTGVSMLPLLQPGEEILVNPKAYQFQMPQVGDIVVAQHPHHENLRLIKRVAAVLEDGSCFLQGDNATLSTDSRSFGIVAPEQILGRVTSRFP